MPHTMLATLQLSSFRATRPSSSDLKHLARGACVILKNEHGQLLPAASQQLERQPRSTPRENIGMADGTQMLRLLMLLPADPRRVPTRHQERNCHHRVTGCRGPWCRGASTALLTPRQSHVVPHKGWCLWWWAAASSCRLFPSGLMSVAASWWHAPRPSACARWLCGWRAGQRPAPT